MFTPPNIQKSSSLSNRNNNKRILSRYDDPANTDAININTDNPEPNVSGQPDNIPPCISDPSQVVYINNVISATRTFAACMNNIADLVWYQHSSMVLTQVSP